MVNNNNEIYKTCGNSDNSQLLETISINPNSRADNVCSSIFHKPSGDLALEQIPEGNILTDDSFLLSNRMKVSVRFLIDLFGSNQVLQKVFDDYLNNDVEKQMFRALLPFSSKERKSIIRLLTCSRRWVVNECVNRCEEHKKIYSCKEVFCDFSKCVNTRIARQLDYLDTLQNPPNKVFHFSYGTNRGNIKKLDNVHFKFISAMRRIINPQTNEYYKMDYIKVLDAGKREFDKTHKVYWHYHYALLWESINYHHFITASRAVLKHIDNDIVLSIKGCQSWRNVKHYFAKRASGKFGHKQSGYYYYKDVMSLRNYYDDYYYKKKLTNARAIPLTCNSGKASEPELCSVCGSVMIFSRYLDIDNNEVFYPP